jgi:hypothetical protein
MGLFLRVYYTPWYLPSNSPDAFIYLLKALSLAENNFQYFDPLFLWPALLSVFFRLFSFDDYFGYMTVMRVISIIISSATIPLVYIISKQFIEKRYATISTFFFAVEPNLIENSIFAITEPLFIFLGLISFYFISQKDPRLYPLAFLSAGLAFDTRLNGIVLFLLLIVAIFLKWKRNFVRIIVIGFVIFLASTISHIIIPLEDGKIPFLGRFINIRDVIVHGNVTPSTYVSNQNGTNIIKNAIISEFLHLFRISIPYLILFFPIGILTVLTSLDQNKKILLSAVIISLIIAVPQYLESNEYRNLFFLIPFSCIFASIGLKKILAYNENEKLFLICLIAAIMLLSINFLKERYDVDTILIHEKEDFGKFVVSNFRGNITGSHFNQIVHYIKNAKINESRYGLLISNNDMSMDWPIGSVFDTKEKLTDYLLKQKIQYIVVGNEPDKRFRIFTDVYYNEKDYPFLIKIFDSSENNYQKLRVKIFTIDYSKINTDYSQPPNL